MNSRERFNITLSYGKADRPPLFDEGMRDEVWKVWRSQGVGRLKDLYPFSTYDTYLEFGPDLRPKPYLHGWPDPKINVKRYAQRMQADDPRRLPKGWRKKVKEWQQREYPLILNIHDGFFITLEVGEWTSFIETIRWVVDEPEYVHKVMEIKSQLIVGLVERILKDILPDAVLFSEPIGGNHGPLISPRHYEEFVMKSYQPILETVKNTGIQHIIMRTFANERALLPVMVKYGINTLWAYERGNSAMDFNAIRAEFGRELRLIGGIDTDAIRSGETAIRRELNNIRPLLDQGGFIPLVDGRIREDIPLNNYLTYRVLLEKTISGG